VSTTLSNLHADTREDFNNPSGSTLGLFTAIQNIGGICALFFCMLFTVPPGSITDLAASYIADFFGRRAGVTLGLLVLFVGTIIQVVPSVNSNMFLAGRFLVGLGLVHLFRSFQQH
jgi:MFS family permease